MREDIVIRFKEITTWYEFKSEIPKIQEELKNPFFRGQGNKFRHAGYSQCGWRLEPSLFREPKNSHPRFIAWLKNTVFKECRGEIEAIIGRQLKMNDQKDKEVVMGLLRHLGFPTPLLDWTENPFKAAYFAFEDIDQNVEKVTIFCFDQNSWKTNPKYLTSRNLRTIELKEIKPLILRQHAQESVYTYCRSCEMYNEILGDGDEDEGNEDFIAYSSLFACDKDSVLGDLNKMCITRRSLYPDERNPKILALKKKIMPLHKRYILFLRNQNK